MKPTDLVEIAQALVRIPSVNPTYDPSSPGEQRIGEWIREWGVEQGFDGFVQDAVDGRPNVALRFRNGADHPHLLLNGHFDTVGVQGMSIPPFGGEIARGRLWGRGAADMKGALAGMLAALRWLRDQAASWKGTLTVGCVADEEHRFRGIRKLMDEMPAPDFAVVGEPTSLRVVRGCKGCLRFTIRAQGKAAHTSDPTKGINAIVAMSDAVLQLDRFFREELSRLQRPDFGPSTGCVSLTAGGTGINIVPEHCSADVDVRLLPGQDWRQTHQDIQRCVQARATRVPNIRWIFDEPKLVDLAMDTPADSKLVRAACEGMPGGQAQAEVVSYGCDASKIAAKSVPCIIMGPGDIACAHTADESVPTIELEDAARRYVELSKRLMPPAQP